MITRILLVLTMVFALAACNRDNVSVNANGDGTATVSISLNEAEVNTLITNALNNSANPLLRNPSVDLQNGQIVISGEHDRRDGNGRVSGTVTLQVQVENGELTAQIVSADIEGWDVSDERITEFNQALAERLSGRARQDNPRATLSAVTITDDNMKIDILVTRRSN